RVRSHPQGGPHLQSAGCPRRNQRHGKGRLYRPHPQPVAQRGAGVLRLSREIRIPHVGQPLRAGGRRMTSQPQTRPLLVELLTEELPPKALQRLGQAFAEGLRASLQQQHLLADACTVRPLATPRRLAALFDAVLKQAPEQRYTEKLMPAKVGLTGEGAMT